MTLSRPSSRSATCPAATLALALAAAAALTADIGTRSSLPWRAAAGVTAATMSDGTVYFATTQPVGPARPAPSTLAVYTFSVDDATAAPIVDPQIAAEAIGDDGTGGWYVAGEHVVTGTTEAAHILGDGTVDPSFHVALGGLVSSLTWGAGALAIGGDAITVGGVARGGLAIVDGATGALLPSDTVNGRVRSLTGVGRWLIVGGDFTVAGGLPRVGLAVFDLSTGRVQPFDAGISGPAQVWATTSDSVWIFLAGSFTAVRGAARAGLAKVNLQTGALDPLWAPATNGTVRALATGARSLVFLGGTFSSVNGQPRSHLAAVHPDLGVTSAWRADTDGDVRGLAYRQFDVVAIGDFTTVAGQPRPGAASVEELVTARVLPWYPAIEQTILAVDTYAGGSVADSGIMLGRETRPSFGLRAADLRRGTVLPWAPRVTGAGITTMIAAGTDLIVGGTFTAIDGHVRQNLAAFDLATRELRPLSLTLDGPVQALAAIGQTLYVAGAFTTVNGQSRTRLCAVDLASGQLLPWAPQANGPVTAMTARADRVLLAGSFTAITDATGIQARTSLAEVTAGGLVTAFDAHVSGGDVTAVMVDGTRVFLSGSFTAVQGAARTRAAALTVDTAVLLPWAPVLDHEATSLAARRGFVYLAGRFFQVNGQNRNNQARVDDVTGATSPWTPPLMNGGSVHHVEVSEAGVLILAPTDTAFAGSTLSFYPDESLPGVPGPPVITNYYGRGTVLLTWQPGAMGATATSYLLEAGSRPGAADLGVLPLAQASFTASGVPSGTYHLRVRSVNGAGASAPSHDLAITLGTLACTGVPLPVDRPAVSVTGNDLSLSWTAAPGAAPTNYILQAGTAEGRTDIGVLPLGAATSFTVSGVPNGVYFVRVVSTNRCGFGAPAGDAVVRVGAAAGPPAAPVQLTGTSAPGGVVSIGWLTSPLGGVPASHVMEVGSGPGLADLGTLPLGPATSLTAPGVPSGTYYLRVRAVNAAGASADSGELVLVVP